MLIPPPSSHGDYAVVIGMPARDTKRFADGTTAESLGGVLFSALAMSALCRVIHVDVAPVCNLGTDIAESARRLLASSGCRIDGTRIVPENTQHSVITFTSADERFEDVHGELPMLEIDDITPWLKASFIAVNFITGKELSLATFRELRARYRGDIIMDYHTLALDTLSDGRRVPRRRDDWSAWIECADVVQMNRVEAETLAGRSLPERDDCAAFARDLLAFGPAAAVITLDEDGAVGAQKAGVEDGSTRHEVMYQQPYAPPAVVDTVGSGDVFLAGLAAGWSSWRKLRPALKLAVTAAGMNCGYEGTSGSANLSRAWLDASHMG